MTTLRKPMICPKCGATMNQHADKLIDHPRNHEEAKHVDAQVGGAILEIHQCPACGASATRFA